MIRQGFKWLSLILAAGLAALALGGAVLAEPPTAAPPDDARQVLVMLRLPPEHFRASADYSGGYGDAAGSAGRQRIARRLAHGLGLTLADSWPMPLLGVDCFVMIAPATRSTAEVAAQLSRDPDVAWAQPMNVYQGRGAAPAPTDSLFRVQPAARDWRLAELHEAATGRNIRVAVIDSRVQADHPDLIGQIQLSENFVVGRPDVPEQHGTGVAGIIAARSGNGPGIVGVAPQARLMALRACWQAPARPEAGPPPTLCDTLSLARALSFAIDHRAEVINLSLSGPSDPLLGKLLDAALQRGATVVGAFDPDLPGGGFPASHAGVVAVSDGWPSPAPGIYTAPGRYVPTTQPGGRWFLVSGNSYAAAHVSGLFALLRERNPASRGAWALVTRPPGMAIDACGTLRRATGPCDCGCARTSSAAAR